MLFGKSGIEKLKACRVAVFGIGGVGGHCAEALCRGGIGAIDLFDGDTVNITNINRQIVATHNTIGRYKVDVMKERMLEINPDIEVAGHKLYYLPANAGEIDLSVFDYIVDAVDMVAAKLEIICRAKLLSIPVISSMGAANKLDPTAFEVADIYETSVCPLARIMRSELRKRNVESLKIVYSKEPPKRMNIDDSDSISNQLGADREDTEVKSADLEAADVKSADREAANMKSADRGDVNPEEIASGRGRKSIPASNSFVPPVAGLIMAGEVIKDLLQDRGTVLLSCLPT